jgi:large subunit ribosomal protein L10
MALRSDNPRAEKVAQVQEVRELLGSSSAALVTEYRGLKVAEMASLRKSLAQAGAAYRVFKNTLARFAARELGLGELEELLVGPTAIAFVRGGDPAGAAKVLRDTARANPALVIKGGLLSGRIFGPAEAMALADLPSREVLLARLAGALASPLAGFAGVCSAIPASFARALAAVAAKKESAAA